MGKREVEEVGLKMDWDEGGDKRVEVDRSLWETWLFETEVLEEEEVEDEGLAFCMWL